MLKKASFPALLFISMFLCHLSAGCGTGTTAAEIAESYGVLNGWKLQPKIAGLIQSGQADEKIASGAARVRNRVAGLGDSRILVTEYLIHGEVYRVEVRRAIDPTKNIPWNKVRYATSRHGSDKKVVEWLHLASVWKKLQSDSYEAQAEVAYRAWRGVDRKVRGVEVSKGSTPDWEPSEGDLALCVRTSLWPITTMWFRGLSSDGRQKDNWAGIHGFAWDGPYFDSPEGSGGHENQAHSACDGRWVMESAGTGVQGQNTNIENRTYFINLKLYNAIGS